MFNVGFSALPQGTGLAVLYAGIAGVVLPLAEKLGPRPLRRWLPSAASLGLAFVFPASVSLTLFIGALAASLLSSWCKDWSSRFLIAICAGLIAGESITGVGLSLRTMLTGS